MPRRFVGNDIDAAAKLYAAFSGHEAEEIGRVDKPEIPNILVAVGELDFIGYSAIRDGVLEKYIHRFKQNARPLFAVTPDGSQIVLIGGSYDFTERGIVDR